MLIVGRRSRSHAHLRLRAFLRRYRFGSYFLQSIILTTLLIAVPFVTIVVLIYDFYLDAARNEVYLGNLNTTTQVVAGIDSYLERGDRIAYAFFVDTDVLSLYDRDWRRTSYDDLRVIVSIQRKMNVLKRSLSFSEGVSVYFPQHDYIITETSASIDVERLAEPALIPPEPADAARRFYVGDLPNSPLTIVYRFDQTVLAGQHLVFISVLPNQLREITRAVAGNREGTLSIVDSLGRTIYREGRFVSQVAHPSSEVSMRPVPPATSPAPGESVIYRESDTQYVSSAVVSAYADWTHVFTTPIAAYQRRADRLRGLLLVILWIGTGSIILVAFLVSLRVFRPIRFLTELIDRRGDDVWSAADDRSRRLDEVGFIASTIMRDTEKRAQLEHELTRRWDLLRRAQQAALQSQVSPHFLYNALNTLNWKFLELAGEGNEGSAMVEKLSRLLRIGLDGDRRVIPVQEELDHAGLYLDLQKARYGDHLAVSWEIDERAVNYRTVKLTLQPLIENAIYHGVKKRGSAGRIAISCAVNEETVTFRVHDNGPGIDPDRLVELRGTLVEAGTIPSDHIGVANVDQRIKLVFGDCYGVTIASEPATGTEVTITIPKVETTIPPDA